MYSASSAAHFSLYRSSRGYGFGSYSYLVSGGFSYGYSFFSFGYGSFRGSYYPYSRNRTNATYNLRTV